MRIPDHLTCLLRNLYTGQEATVSTRHGTTDWLKIREGVCQGCILSSCLFNLYAEYIMRNSRLEEAQAGIKIAGRNINHLRYAGRRQWHLTSVLLPGKSYGQRSLVGCGLLWSLRVGHNWPTSLSLFTFMHWRRKWQPTPVFLPGESQGRGSHMGCRLWGRTELGTTEVT